MIEISADKLILGFGLFFLFGLFVGVVSMLIVTLKEIKKLDKEIEEGL